MSMRVQLSIMLTDTDLYNGLVLPLKEQRELHSLVVRCLSAYYYSEEARNLIDGINPEEMKAGVSPTQDVCDNIRSYLAMQSFLTSELEQVLNDGMTDVSDILDGVNRMAEDSGVVKSTQSDFGSKTYQITAKKQENSSLGTDSTEPMNTGDEIPKANLLYTLIERVLRRLNDSEGIAIMHRGLGIEDEAEQQVEPETIRETPVVQDVVKVQPPPEVFGISEEEIASFAQESAIPVVAESVVGMVGDATDEAEDASAALMDLFGSI